MRVEGLRGSTYAYAYICRYIYTENVALQAPVFDMSVLLLVEHIVALL